MEAQGAVFDTALDELRRGRKNGHWMWFVFPQLRGLGRSPTARRFGLAGRGEAIAYAAHPVLGPRLRTCAAAMLDHAGTPAETVLGTLDAMKLRSSATLFAALPGADPVFADLLDAFFGGEGCPLTLSRLAGGEVS